MKSDIEIVDDVYFHIKDSGLMTEIKGRLGKEERRAPFRDEDVEILVLADEMVGDVQEVYVNVNIYVHDIIDENGDWVWNRKRLGELCKKVRPVLWVGGIGKDYTFHLMKQRVSKVPDSEAPNEHRISNRLFYQIIDE